MRHSKLIGADVGEGEGGRERGLYQREVRRRVLVVVVDARTYVSP